jgi:MYXO-CTERM domain-containing protein
MKSLQFRLSAFAVFVVFASVVASALAADPIRIMSLGDSITAGYTDNSTWSVPFAFGYRSGLYTRLTDAGYSFQYVGASQEPWNNAFGLPQTVGSPDLRMVDQDFHRGYGGVGADYLSANIGNWLQQDTPDVILLMIGINNISVGSSGEPIATEQKLATLVQSILVQRPTAHLIVAQITPYTTYTDSLVKYNNYVSSLVGSYAAQGKNISMVDQYSNFSKSGIQIDTSLYSNGINHPNAIGYDKMAHTWFNGIQNLGSLTHDAGPAKAVLANGGFESLQYPGNLHNINPADTGWSYTVGSTGAGTGIDHGNPYGSSNSSPAAGYQMGFIQGAGAGMGVSSISQTMNGLIVGKTYSLSFAAKGIADYNQADPFSVSVGGSTLSFSGSTLLTPAVSTNYTNYTTTFVATSSSMPLRFFDAGNVPVTKVSWVDAIKLGVVTPGSANLVSNGSFEQTGCAADSHNVNPSGAGWRFTASGTTAGSGIDRGNPYGAAACPNAVTFDGSQHAFLQGRGEGNGVTRIEQDITGFQTGEVYRLTFEAASIEGFSGANPIFVSVGGSPLDFGGSSYVSPSGSYGLYVSAPFVATGSTMTLQFADGGDVPVTYLSWIDDVQVTAVPEPASGILAAIAGVLLLARWRRRRTG